MKVVTWEEKHQAIKELLAYIYKEAPKFSFATHNNDVVLGVLGLVRCSRFLSAIDLAIEKDLDDTTGGNLRSLYETWVLGHLLMVSNDDEKLELAGETRKKGEDIVRALGIDLDLSARGIEARKAIPIEQRARQLGNKLKIIDPQNAILPEQCYNALFRSESFLGTHASTGSLAKHYSLIENRVVLRHEDKIEWRIELGGIIVVYYAEQLFNQAGLSIRKIERWSQVIGAPI